MKKILIFFFASLLVLSSCEDVETPDLGSEGKQWIQLSKTSESLAENDSDGIVTTVLYSGDSNESGITVNFTITSSDPTRYTVTP